MSRKCTITVGATGVLVWLALACLFIYGWVSNIIAIVHASSDPLNPLLVLRFLGVLVAPLGAVLGYVG